MWCRLLIVFHWFYSLIHFYFWITVPLFLLLSSLLFLVLVMTHIDFSSSPSTRLPLVWLFILWYRLTDFCKLCCMNKVYIIYNGGLHVISRNNLSFKATHQCLYNNNVPQLPFARRWVCFSLQGRRTESSWWTWRSIKQLKIQIFPRGDDGGRHWATGERLLSLHPSGWHDSRWMITLLSC